MPLGIEQVVRGMLHRSRRGLYGGRTRLSGNQISEDGKNKTRRVWKPNVQRKYLWSEALNRDVRLHVTTACLRTIDKYGGLDQFLLTTPDAKLASDVGTALKKEIRDALRRQREQATADLFGSAAPAPASPVPARPASEPSAPQSLAEAGVAAAAAVAASPVEGMAAAAAVDAALAAANPLTLGVPNPSDFPPPDAAPQKPPAADAASALAAGGEQSAGDGDRGVAGATTAAGAAWLPEASAASDAAAAAAMKEAAATAQKAERRERVGWGQKCRPKRTLSGVRRRQKLPQWQIPRT